MQPSFVSPSFIPPLPIRSEELLWIHVDDAACILWDRDDDLSVSQERYV